MVQAQEQQMELMEIPEHTDPQAVREALLNIPTRADWKECKQTRAEEEECSGRLREQFKPYDFALED
ncbi:hypothetical protein CRUP_008577 [Coryphaenoides rupestris]|nr:hypothetical protein CRUP_008577 [Coryphaenoides rupestris]